MPKNSHLLSKLGFDYIQPITDELSKLKSTNHSLRGELPRRRIFFEASNDSFTRRESAAEVRAKHLVSDTTLFLAADQSDAKQLLTSSCTVVRILTTPDGAYAVLKSSKHSLHLAMVCLDRSTLVATTEGRSLASWSSLAGSDVILR